MKAVDVFYSVARKEYLDTIPWTVDKLIYGDPEKEVKKVGTCLCATPEIIKAAKEWGADMLIVHEPTFYNHTDTFEEGLLANKKKAMLDEAGFVIFRYHDAMHFQSDDEVNLDVIERCGLCGNFDGDMKFTVNEPVTPRTLAKAAVKGLELGGARIVGNADFEAKNILLATGMRGTQCYKDFVNSTELEIAICGEFCEWEDGEPIRDAAQFGLNKAVIILGHAGSEKMSMERLAQNINKKNGIEVKYFDCGEIYTYID